MRISDQEKFFLYHFMAAIRQVMDLMKIEKVKFSVRDEIGSGIFYDKC